MPAKAGCVLAGRASPLRAKLTCRFEIERCGSFVTVMNIYVGNLPYTTDDRELQAEFEQFGQVSRAQVIMDRETGRSKGFGFVEMPDDGEARQAIEELNGKQVGGRPLRVNEAQPRPARRGGGGGPRRESSY